MDFADGRGGVRNGQEVALERFVAAGPEGLEPVFGDPDAGLRFDERGFVLHGLAGEGVHRLFGGEVPAEFAEHLGEHAVGDGFGIDEDAVAVEKDGVEGKWGHCAEGSGEFPHGSNDPGRAQDAGWIGM